MWEGASIQISHEVRIAMDRRMTIPQKQLFQHGTYKRLKNDQRIMVKLSFKQ